MKVLLELEVEEVDREDGRTFDKAEAPGMVAAYASDALQELTRKEFYEPWRIVRVRMVETSDSAAT